MKTMPSCYVSQTTSSLESIEAKRIKEIWLTSASIAIEVKEATLLQQTSFCVATRELPGT
jgi:hypothetical protein